MACSREKQLFHYLHSNLISRCYKKSNASYKYFGELGYTVCRKWVNDVDEMYRWAKKNGWNKDLAITIKTEKFEFNPENCFFIPKNLPYPHLKAYFKDSSKKEIFHETVCIKPIKEKKLGFFSLMKLKLVRYLLR